MGLKGIGFCFNITTTFSEWKYTHYEDEKVMIRSFLYIGNPSASKMVSLYLDGPVVTYIQDNQSSSQL